MTIIQFNEGSELFFGDERDARAVKLLWNTTLEEAPTHLAHLETPDFFRAWLAAQSVKVDLFEFLHRVWNAVWLRPGMTAQSLGEISKEREFHSDPLISWTIEPDTSGNLHSAYGVVRTPSGKLVECLAGLDAEGQLNLWAFAVDGFNRCPRGWSDPGDEYVYASSLGQISESGLDVTRAIEAAEALLPTAR